MARHTLALSEITELDLNLAQNDNALAAASEIHALAPDERAERLTALQRRIDEGTATLFEERVLPVLLAPRGAERILAIQRHLPRIRAALAQRSAAQTSTASPQPAAQPTAAPSSTPEWPAQPAAASSYQSELLDFIASQKPPAPTSAAKSAARGSDAPAEARQSPARWSWRDRVMVAVLLLLAGLSVAYILLSNRPSDTRPLTFEQQARQQAAASQAPAIPPDDRAEFEAAVQALRSGDFEQAATRVQGFIEQYPESPQAEAGYMALGDAARQRQNDPDLALQYYQRLLDQFPNSLQKGLVTLKMGFAYEDLEDAANAETLYRLVLDQHGRRSRVGQLAAQRLNALTAAASASTTP